MNEPGTALAAERILWEEQVPGGCHWSALVRRGTTLRLTDVSGGANVAALFFNAEEKLERYNAADTLKAQHTARLTRGNVCYSDMGRVLCSITADTCGWHDPIGGYSNAASVRRCFGDARFQEYRNGMFRNARDGLLIELGKYGLGKRDLVTGINFFSKVRVNETGAMQYVPGNSRAGDFVDLRFEMNSLVVLSTAPHPMAPAGEYPAQPVTLTAWRSEPVGADDFCRNYRPENVRGFENTERLYRGAA